MAADGRITVAQAARAEFSEKKSRFIGQIGPAADEDAALAFLNALKAEHKGATHHCYAWQIGPNDCFQRSSDAGEPAGTAGRPILEAIKRQELHDTVLVVTRYFGGILLGAGGLTRAYAKAATLAIAAASLVRRVPATRQALYFQYNQLGRVEALLQQLACPIEDRLFGTEAGVICLVRPELLPQLDKLCADLSNGGLRRQELGEAVLELPLSAD